MQIIAELENSPRQVYTGCIGFITPRQRMQFNVAIRTVLVNGEGGLAEYGVGGGIVWDSTAAGEYEECRIKARVLTQPRPVFSLLESLLWEPAQGYFLLEQHLQRLADSSEYFAFPFARDPILAALERLAAGLPDEPHKVRLLLDRKGRIECQVQALAAIALPETARLRPALHPVSSQDVFLAHKTTHRQAYTQARLGLPAGVEPLLWNELGEFTEAESANLVGRLEGRLVTPPVACGLLPGTFRQWLLDHGQVQEAVLHLEDLPRCEELWLVNSVRRWRKAILVQ
jgi:para-aminobenzoate synthetase/4-amino-4-deoxychorismate lyase